MPLPPLPLIYLLDGNGGAWLLGVTNGGLLTTTFSASPSVAPVTQVFLEDARTFGQYWGLSVTTSPIAGIPQVNPATTATQRTRIACLSPNQTIWIIQILNGISFTEAITTCLAELVGTVYIPNYNGIPWTQPGGPGTTVFPQQQSNPWANYPVAGQFFIEASGLWTVGCGHWVDYPYVWRDYDACTGESCAIVSCPICSYIQYLMEPYEAFDDPLTNAITII